MSNKERTKAKFANGGRILLNIKSGQNLVAKDKSIIGGFLGKKAISSDPYVKIMCGDREVGKTKTVPKSLNPVWEEQFMFELEPNDRAVVELQLYDHDAFNQDDAMGEIKIDLLSSMNQDGYVYEDKEYDVETCADCDNATGTVKLSIIFNPETSSKSSANLGGNKGKKSAFSFPMPTPPSLDAGKLAKVEDVVKDPLYNLTLQQHQLDKLDLSSAELKAAKKYAVSMNMALASKELEHQFEKEEQEVERRKRERENQRAAMMNRVHAFSKIKFPTTKTRDYPRVKILSTLEDFVGVEVPSLSKTLKSVEALPEGCAERLLWRLLLHFKDDSPSSNMDVAEILDQLKARIVLEELSTITLNDEIRAMKNYVTSRNRSDWDREMLEEKCLECIKEVQPIDADLLVDLLKQGKLASKGVEGKDVLLLLGKTGAGKSTTIKFIGGAKFERTDVDGHIGCGTTSDCHPFLEYFESAGSVESQTVFVKGIDLELDTTEFMLVDTPGIGGTGDTRGPEVDIANAINITMSMRSAKTVRPVLLINGKDCGGRLTGISEQLGIVVDMLAPIEDNIDSFNYVFTRFDLAEYKGGDRMLTHFNEKCAADKSNKTDTKEVKEMVRHCRDKIEAQGAMVLDPIKDDPNAFTTTLLDIVKAPPIEDPQKMFKNFATPQNSALLIVQLKKHKASVINALSRTDVDMMEKKLSQLSVFAEYLKMDSVMFYQDSVKEVKLKCDNMLMELGEKLGGLMDNNDHEQDEQDLFRCLEIIAFLIKLDLIREKYFPTVASFESSCRTVMSNTMRKLATSVTSLLVGNTDSPVDCDVLSKCDIVLCKMDLFSEIFGQYFQQFDTSNHFRKAVKATFKSFESLRTKFMASCDRSDVEGCISELGVLDLFSSLISKHNVLENCVGEEDQDEYSVSLIVGKFEEAKARLIEAVKIPFEITNTCLNDETKEMWNFKESEVGGLHKAVNVAQIVSKEPYFSTDADGELCDHFDTLTKGINAHLVNAKVQVEKESPDFEKIKEMVLGINRVRADKLVGNISFEAYGSFCASIQKQINDFDTKLRSDIKQHLSSWKLDAVMLASDLRKLEGAAVLNKEDVPTGTSGLYNDQHNTLCTELSVIFQGQYDDVHNAVFDYRTTVDTMELFGIAASFAAQFMSAYGRERAESDGSNTLLGSLKQLIGEFKSKLRGEVAKGVSFFEMSPLNVLSSVCWNAVDTLNLGLKFELNEAMQAKGEILASTKYQWGDVKNNFNNSFEQVFKKELYSSDDYETRKKILSKLIGWVKNMKLKLDFYESKKADATENHTIVFLTHVKPLYDDWLHKLDEHHKQLLSASKSSGMTLDLLEPMWNMARALASVDDSLTGSQSSEGGEVEEVAAEEETNKSKGSFEAIVKDFKEMIDKIQANVSREISSGNFSKVAEYFQKNPADDEAREKLCDHLVGILNRINEGCVTLVLSLDEDDQSSFFNYIDDLKELSLAEETVSQDLPTDMKATFSDDIKQARTTMLKIVNVFLGTANTALAQYDYIMFENTLQAVLNIETKMFVKEGDDPLSKGILALRLTAAKEFKDKLCSEFESLMDEVKDHYSTNQDNNTPFDDLKVSWSKRSPKGISLSLESAGQISADVTTFYHDLNDELTDLLEKMFTNLVSLGSDASIQPEIRQELLSGLDTILCFLPSKLSLAVSGKIKTCNDKLSTEMKFLKASMEDASDISELLIKMEESWEKSWYPTCLDYQTSISVKINESLDSFEQRLKTNPHYPTLLEDELPQANSDWNNFAEKVKKYDKNVGYHATISMTRTKNVKEVQATIARISKFRGSLTESVNVNLQNLANMPVSDQVGRSRGGGPNVFGEPMLVCLDLVVTLFKLRNSEAPLKSMFEETLDITEDKQAKALTTAVSIFNHFHDEITSLLKEEEINFSKLDQVLTVFSQSKKTHEKLVAFKTDLSGTSSNFATSILDEFKDSDCSYDQAAEDMNKTLSDLISRLKPNLRENKELCSQHADRRDTYYKGLFIDYTNLNNCADCMDKYSTDKTVCHEHLKVELDEIKAALDSRLNRFDDHEKFSNLYDNLRSFRDAFKGKLAIYADDLMEDIKSDFMKKVKTLVENAKQLKDNKKFVNALYELKDISERIPLMKKSVDGCIDGLLNDPSDEEGEGSKRLLAITLLLTKPVEGFEELANKIMNEHKHFAGQMLRIFNEKVSRFTIDDVCKKITSKPEGGLTLGTLREEFQIFDESYKQLIQGGLSNPEEGSQNCVKAVEKTLKNPSLDTLEKARRFLVQIFGYWSLSHAAANPPDGEEKKGDDWFLLKPHAGQIAAILRMLGFDDRGEINNHFIQIGTGEGKSVILGVLACILALQGYSVNCACYSDYLSKRDYEGFLPMFTAFGVHEYVTYGTFPELCEGLLNVNADIRKSVINIIETPEDDMPTKVQGTRGPASERKLIILIDEADVFFNEDFFGNKFNVSTKLRGPEVEALLDAVWKSHQTEGEIVTASKVRNSKEYKALIKRYPQWCDLLREHVQTMVGHLKTFESIHGDVKIDNDRIAYKYQDGTSDKLSYGYQTTWAYYKFNSDEKLISDESLKIEKCLTVACGAFSYAQIPKEVHRILGVSGSLDTITDVELGILEQDYGIHKKTYIPSVYGDNKLRFIPKRKNQEDVPDIKIVEEAGYYTEITSEIKNRREIADKLCPVIVIFENRAAVEAYVNSPSVANSSVIKNAIKVLTERTPDVNKKSIIGRAASLGSITIMSAEFGRGIDFKCYNGDVVDKLGGVHVLQTYLSPTQSEEKQNKGRTARQGAKGSYSMVLSVPHLETHGITTEAIKEMNDTGDFYDTLHQSRLKNYTENYHNVIAKVSHILGEHNEARKFINLLGVLPTSAGSSSPAGGGGGSSSLSASSTTSPKQNLKSMIDFLVERNRSTMTEDPAGSRTIVLVDATSSMGNMLKLTISTLQIVFAQVKRVLDANDEMKGKSYEVKLGCYRNYNSEPKKLYECSAYQSDVALLSTFLESIKVSGGWGAEAVEIGLWDVNKDIVEAQDEGEMKYQVIVIGDAPPNSKADVAYKRSDQHGAGKGEAVWAKTPFNKPTNCDDELAKLKANDVPVHTFSVESKKSTPVLTAKAKKEVEAAFLLISQNGGPDAICESLNIEVGGDGAKKLTKLMTECILNDVAGRGEAGEAMKQEFRNAEATWG